MRQDRLRLAKMAHLAGRKLDRQGQAVQPGNDVGGTRCVLIGQFEGRSDSSSAVDEQVDGVRDSLAFGIEGRHFVLLARRRCRVEYGW